MQGQVKRAELARRCLSPTTNDQRPTTNDHQPPTTNHQPPTTNHQQPTANSKQQPQPHPSKSVSAKFSEPRHVENNALTTSKQACCFLVCSFASFLCRDMHHSRSALDRRQYPTVHNVAFHAAPVCVCSRVASVYNHCFSHTLPSQGRHGKSTPTASTTKPHDPALRDVFPSFVCTV